MLALYKVFLPLIALSIAMAPRDSAAYLPGECRPDSAKDDFQGSPLIVIGRVTGVERYRVDPPERLHDKPGVKEYFYVATINVGRTIKGDAKAGDEIHFFAGFSHEHDGADLRSNLVHVANTHSGWNLQADSAYLLFLRRPIYLDDRDTSRAEVRRDGAWQKANLDQRNLWEPRSCHYSIHRVSSGRDFPQVSLYLPHGGGPDAPLMPLDDFSHFKRLESFPKVVR